MKTDEPNGTIHDVLIRPLELRHQGAGSRIAAYRFADHLLYRVGLVEQVELAPSKKPQLVQRSQADEVWALTDGACTFAWIDNRPDSPTHDRRQFHFADTPTVVLAPFGVAFGVSTEVGATLIRLATHDEAEDGEPVVLPWPTG